MDQNNQGQGEGQSEGQGEHGREAQRGHRVMTALELSQQQYWHQVQLQNQQPLPMGQPPVGNQGNGQGQSLQLPLPLPQANTASAPGFAIPPPPPLAMGPSDQNLPQQAPSGPRGIPSALPLENVGGWPGAGAVGGAGAAAAAAAAGYVGYAPQPTLNAHAGPSNQAAANNAPNNQQQAENNTGSAAAPSNPSQVAAPSNSAQMTIAERLDRGLITTIQGLNQRETEQLIDWARAQRPKITWNEIHRRFRFKDFGERWAVSTLRGNRRNRTYRDDPPANGHRRRAPPRVAEITDSDDDLILEAVETIAGGHLDNVDGKVPHRLWTRVQDHLKANGSNTTAGTARIKQRYRTLTSEVPTMDSSMRFQPLKWDHKGYEQYQVPGLEEASFHDDLEVEPEREAEVQSEPEIEDEIVVERQSEPSDQEDEEQAEDESSEDNEEDGSSDGYEYDANDDDEEEDN